MKEKISVHGAPDFMEFFNSLDNTSDRYKEISEALDLLRKDYAKGDKISRNLWPKKYSKEYQVHTLFRFKLRSGWRLVYTIYGTKQEKVCTILEAFDHKEYEKRFGY